MLWCKDTFEQHFDADQCRLFPVQQQLFDFVDKDNLARAASLPDLEHWRCFSIEFPSPSDVSRLLSRHAPTRLFQRAQAAPEDASPTRKRAREDFSLLYGTAPLSQQSRFFLAATLEGLRFLLARIEARQLHLYEIIREGRPCHLYLDVEREANHVALHETVTIDDSSDVSSSSSSRSSPSSSVEEADAVVRVDEVGEGDTRRTVFRCPRERYRALRRRVPHEPPDACGLDCPVVPNNSNTCDVLLDAVAQLVRERHPEWLSAEHGAGTLDSVFAEVWVLRSVPLRGPATKFSQHYVFKLHRHMFDSTSSVKVFVRELVTALSAQAPCSPGLHAAAFFHKAPVWYPVFAELAPDHPRNTLPYLPRGCVVDEAVYSRNRMMRCVGSCKLGKLGVLRPYRHYVAGKPVAHFPQSFTDNMPLTLSMLMGTLIAPPLRHDTEPPRLILLADPAEDRSAAAAGLALCPRTAQPTPKWTASACDVGGVNVAALAASLERAYSAIARRPCSVSPPRTLDGHYLTFSVRGTRYCQNVGREHKSNNVYLVLDTQRMTFVQKCFDPDCAAFRSPPRPLPGAAPSA